MLNQIAGVENILSTEIESNDGQLASNVLTIQTNHEAGQVQGRRYDVAAGSGNKYAFG